MDLIGYSKITGSSSHKNLVGYAVFEPKFNGLMVTVKVNGLPFEKCKNEIYGLHIHEGESCTGNEKDEFADTKMHFSTNDCAHPYHTGDLPPIFSNDGFSYMTFFTNKFSLNDIIGKTIVIHSNPDDFTTQPSGNSGQKIACGVIEEKYI